MKLQIWTTKKPELIDPKQQQIVQGLKIRLGKQRTELKKS